MKTIRLLLLCLLFFISNNLISQTTFEYTGSVQNYIVPECVSNVTVDLKGAEGSSQAAAANPTGKGGRVQATLEVIPGTTLKIYVGGAGVAGSAAAGGWNGGGTTGTGTGGTGGGASDIRIGGVELVNRVIVAAGGGGAGSTYSTNNKGGDGGGITGKNGLQSGNYSAGACGSGGTATGGGTGNGAAASGDLGQGGTGGAHGGGGGGGYYGGGAGSGATICCTGGGGGGGSSFADSNYTSNVIHASGFQTGNGQVIITTGLKGAPRPGIIYGEDSLCIGKELTFLIEPIPLVDSFIWVFPEGTEILSGQGSNNVLVKIGTIAGEISLTCNNSCGKSIPRTKSFNPKVCLDSGTNIWTQNRDGNFDFFIFPNPASTELNLEISKPLLKAFRIEFINAMGQNIYSREVDGIKGTYSSKVDLSLFSKGIYFCRLIDDNKVYTKLLMVQ